MDLGLGTSFPGDTQVTLLTCKSLYYYYEYVIKYSLTNIVSDGVLFWREKKRSEKVYQEDFILMI